LPSLLITQISKSPSRSEEKTINPSLVLELGDNWVGVFPGSGVIASTAVGVVISPGSMVTVGVLKMGVMICVDSPPPGSQLFRKIKTAITIIIILNLWLRIKPSNIFTTFQEIRCIDSIKLPGVHDNRSLTVSITGSQVEEVAILTGANTCCTAGQIFVRWIS
jgi:hypothetical protein